MNRILSSSVRVAALPRPVYPLCLRFVRLFLAGRCFDYYDGAKRANCHIGEMLCQFGMVRSKAARLAISCFMLEGRIRIPANHAVTDAIPLSKGRWSFSIDIYVAGNKLRSISVMSQVRPGTDPINLLSRKILPKLVWVLLFDPRLY